MAGGQPVGATLNGEFIAQEIVRSVVATIGIVAAVAMTTALAVLVTSAGRPAEPTGAQPDREPEPPAATAAPVVDDPWRDDDLWSGHFPSR
ncbi:YibE/F family protein [Dactylosporangium sp. AC04546]|uniref:YibE/F family protein n=1 Tax=Dactylosporangium sp. AC04546 TaxID=2862460 RepID=UPI003FA481B8